VLTLLVLADSLELGCEEEDEPVKLLNQPIAAGGGTMQPGGRNELGLKGKGLGLTQRKYFLSLKNFSPRRGAALGFGKTSKLTIRVSDRTLKKKGRSVEAPPLTHRSTSHASPSV
jgi:hypothetical protein